jgi:hypothetical protein
MQFVDKIASGAQGVFLWVRRPVVSDSAGVLYNKDAILQYLLPAKATTIDKDEYSKVLQSHVKSLKDVVEVLFKG